jgi:hypothetical protein
MSEVSLFFPCEENLWNATNAQDWFRALQEPSPYGSTSERLTGASLMDTLILLSQQEPLANPPAFNTFTHFLIIHILNAQIFCLCAADRLPGGYFAGSQSAQAQIYGLRHSLHNWLQSWKMTHEVTEFKPKDDGPRPFINHAVQYYWVRLCQRIFCPFADLNLLFRSVRCINSLKTANKYSPFLEIDRAACL